MNFVSTLGAAALSCLLLPAAFASEPAGTALESSSAAIAPEVREVEKAPSTELAAAPAASSQEASSDSQSDTSNAWRPRITILLDTGMTSSLVETAAEELKLVGDAADVEVLVRGLPVTRTPTGYRTDFEATSERLAPLVDSGKPASSVWTERCFFGKESSAASGTVTEETSAVARAIFSGVCTSTDATTETVKCSEVLESNNDHGCVLGDKTTARVNGEYSLSHDPCSDGDVLIGQHTCGNSSYLAIQVKGFKSTRISLGYTLRNIAHRTNSSCKADYEWTKRECSGPTCTAKLGARVYYNGYMTGSMRLTLTYVNESYYIKEEWVDHCASIRPRTAATAEGS